MPSLAEVLITFIYLFKGSKYSPVMKHILYLKAFVFSILFDVSSLQRENRDRYHSSRFTDEATEPQHFPSRMKSQRKGSAHQRSWEVGRDFSDDVVRNPYSTDGRPRSKVGWFCWGSAGGSCIHKGLEPRSPSCSPRVFPTHLSVPAYSLPQHACLASWQRSSPMCWLKMKGERDYHVLLSHPVQLCQASKALWLLISKWVTWKDWNQTFLVIWRIA